MEQLMHNFKLPNLRSKIYKLFILLTRDIYLSLYRQNIIIPIDKNEHEWK